MPRLNTLEELQVLQHTLSSPKVTVTMCGGTGCRASGCMKVVEAFQAELGSRRLTGSVKVRITGCHGFCEQGPLMVIDPANTLYRKVSPEDVPEIIDKTIQDNKIVERLLYQDPVTGKTVTREQEVPFYLAQDRMLLAQNRQVNPCSIEDYIAIGGYAAFAKVLREMSPAEVIDEVRLSGLRGRGGGGFPTGRKWEQCRAAPGREKFVICNADEGDPGAYMDRSILEGNPHAVIEGMLIAAYAIGASGGFIYVRTEYPLAVKHTGIALEQARHMGLLGEEILGSGFSFDTEIARGAGAFVCGESTALMASLEGRVGEPRAKDVHTVESGLWGKPSNLNNVETYANVPLIISKGSAWYASKGTENSRGTKVFALTGQIKNTGLVEVAMGTPLRKIIYDIGGGPANESRIKAVQTGGPSGGCLPESMFDLPVDFDTLAEAGSMVGSGGMVVMDERTCMVDVARYFLAFLQDESCGKCVPCRVGVDRMLEILTDICEGRARPEQLDLLEDLADTVAHTSLCALGKTAPNPVLSTLKYFRKEYETHILDRRCPAGVCKSLITYAIDADMCNGCGACLRACPTGAISGEKKQPHRIDPAKCNRCGVCGSECKSDAIIIVEEMDDA